MLSRDTTVQVGSDGFIYVNGVKLQCKKLANGSLQFCIKDKRIAAENGSKFVEVTPKELEAVDKDTSTI